MNTHSVGKSKWVQVRYYSPVLPLNSRLGRCASMIAPEARAIVDVGYDHGQLLAHLRQTRPELSLFGTEVLEDAGERFVATYGEGVADLRLGSGLSTLSPGEVDVVVFAGLSDRTILRLLDEGRAHLPHLRQVICCPPALEAHLRPGLADLGLVITDEALVFKRHRSYDVIASAPGPVDEPPHPWGPTLIERRDPDLLRHLEIQRRLLRRDLDQGLRSHRRADGSLGPMGEKLARLDALLAEARSWSA